MQKGNISHWNIGANCAVIAALAAGGKFPAQNSPVTQEKTIVTA
jgi:hypothetical protein